MAKKNPLSAGLEAKRKSRKADAENGSDVLSGRALVAGHFTVAVQRCLRMIAAEEGTTVQALLAEGLNTVFAKRGKPEIASSTTAGLGAAPKAEVAAEA